MGVRRSFCSTVPRRAPGFTFGRTFRVPNGSRCVACVIPQRTDAGNGLAIAGTDDDLCVPCFGDGLSVVCVGNPIPVAPLTRSIFRVIVPSRTPRKWRRSAHPPVTVPVSRQSDAKNEIVALIRKRDSARKVSAESHQRRHLWLRSGSQAVAVWSLNIA